MGLYHNGINYNDPWDFPRELEYRACPESVKVLEDILDKADPKYEFYNVEGKSCIGFACDAIERTGGTPPIPNTGFIWVPEVGRQIRPEEESWSDLWNQQPPAIQQPPLILPPPNNGLDPDFQIP